jgi:carboxypeptidase family protein
MTRTQLLVAAAVTLALGCRAAGLPDPELPCVPAVQYFESVHLPDSYTVAAFRGKVSAGSRTDAGALAGVQVHVREVRGGTVHSAVSDDRGAFQFDALPRGTYDAWTCFDGFDRIVFRLAIEPRSQVNELELFMRPSESGGEIGVFVSGKE